MAKLPLDFPLKWIIVLSCLIVSGTLLFTNEKIEEPVSTQRSYLMFESGIRAKETQEHTKST